MSLPGGVNPSPAGGSASHIMAGKQPMRRGSRRSSSPPPPPRKPPPHGWRLWLRRAMIWGGALALVGAIFLGVAVAVTARSLPSYAALKSSQVGQMIVVRAADGTEIVTLGPSYGHWVPSAQIPQVMKDAMISIEDRRFFEAQLGRGVAEELAAGRIDAIGAAAEIDLVDRKSTRLNSSHLRLSRMPSSA